MRSIGFLETSSLARGVEAADAMLKTAGVRLSRYEVTRDALVTVLIHGPLGDVEAAVEAGARAATRVGELVARHVIPAPDPQLQEPIARSGR